MVVHDIEMDDVGAGLENVVDFLAEFGEVGGENARGNPEVFGHGELLKRYAPILPVARRTGFRKCDGGHKGKGGTRRQLAGRLEFRHSFKGIGK